MSELKPCPFCGADFVPVKYGPPGWYHAPTGSECPGHQMVVGPEYVDAFNNRVGEHDASTHALPRAEP